MYSLRIGWNQSYAAPFKCIKANRTCVATFQYLIGFNLNTTLSYIKKVSSLALSPQKYSTFTLSFPPRNRLYPTTSGALTISKSESSGVLPKLVFKVLIRLPISTVLRIGDFIREVPALDILISIKQQLKCYNLNYSSTD